MWSSSLYFIVLAIRASQNLHETVTRISTLGSCIICGFQRGDLILLLGLGKASIRQYRNRNMCKDINIPSTNINGCIEGFTIEHWMEMRNTTTGVPVSQFIHQPGSNCRQHVVCRTSSFLPNHQLVKCYLVVSHHMKAYNKSLITIVFDGESTKVSASSLQNVSIYVSRGNNNISHTRSAASPSLTLSTTLLTHCPHPGSSKNVSVKKSPLVVQSVTIGIN